MTNDKIQFSIPAMRIYQRENEGQSIYVGRIKATDFSTHSEERFKIDYFAREDGKNTGYQRRLAQKAVNKIKDFVLKESKHPMFPTSILASSRVPLDFKETSSGIGTLHIYEPLYVIDGQHRFEAWKSIMNDQGVSSLWADYDFPIVVMSGFKELDEMEQFYVINFRQKKIKTDLVHRLLLEFEKTTDTQGLVSQKDKWIPRAVATTNALNETEGIWKGLIGYDTDSDNVRLTRVIQATSFHASLKPLFVGNKRLFSIEKPQIDDWISLLKDYWDAIGEIYPHCIASPFQYSLMKTVGVNAFHIFLVEKANSLGLGLNDKAELVKKAREGINKAAHIGFSENFWLSHVSRGTKSIGRYAGAYSSSSGHKRLAMGMMEEKLI